MDALAFKNVTLTIGGKVYLRNVDLVLEEGETLVVVGNPGCGKSLILRAALGFPGMGDGEEVKMEGEIYLWGQLMAELQGRQLQQARMRIGSLLRGGSLIDNMDVRRNITFPLYYHFQDQMAAEDIEARCALLLADMGLGFLGEPGRRPVTLNREERLYVGLARALVNQPILFLLDDPAVGLGAVATAKLKKFLFYEPQFADGFDLGGRGEGTLTRLITTNCIDTYLDCGDRFAVLDRQTIEVVGDRCAMAQNAGEFIR
jgi:ABC-type transporter Mla maintaining outer membrane lipid asymmetry ATPase subunit MlaF